MPLPLIIAGVAAAGFAGEVLIGNGAIDPEVLRHRAPEDGRTLYLPVSNDGGIDGNDPSDPTSVDALDAKIEEVNAAGLDVDPTHLYSYCEGDGCDEGGDCTDVAGPRELLVAAQEAGITAAFDALSERIESISGTVGAYAATEQVAARLVAVYRGEGNFDFNLNKVNADLKATREAFVQAVSTSSDAANEALATTRLMVQSLRNTLAERAEHRVNAATLAWAVPQMINPVGAVITGGMTAWDVFQANGAQAAGPDAVKAASDALKRADDEAANAVTALTNAAGAWSVSPNTASLAGVKAPATDAPTPPAPSTTPVSATPLDTAAPVTGGGAGDADTDTEPSWKDKLDDLLGQPDVLPTPSMGGSPLGDSGMGGMPSMGGGSPMSDPLAGMGAQPEPVEPLADPLADEDDLTDDEPLDDLTDEEGDDADDALDADADADKDALDGDVDAEVDADDADTDDADTDPAEDAGDVAPVAADPAVANAPTSDDITARTADVGGGRMVTFPTAAMADAVHRLMESVDSGGGKTLYLAMSEAGYNLPPLGTDIGQQVPPALLQEGDIVVGDTGTGLYIGNGDVLMESGEVKPLADVAAFSGEHSGLFRAEEAAPPADGLSGPAQPVASDGSAAPVASGEPVTSTPGAVTEQSGTPGVPTDTKADDLSATSDTEAGAGFSTTDNGAEGLDPSSAFPS